MQIEKQGKWEANLFLTLLLCFSLVSSLSLSLSFHSFFLVPRSLYPPYNVMKIERTRQNNLSQTKGREQKKRTFRN